jgi:hypothetical protein
MNVTQAERDVTITFTPQQIRTLMFALGSATATCEGWPVVRDELLEIAKIIAKADSAAK